MRHSFLRWTFALAATFFLMIQGAALAGDGDDEAKPKPPPNPWYRRPDFSLYFSGRYVYERNCLICHGENGDGKGELGVTLPVKPRSFLQGVFKYRSTPPGKMPTDDDLRRTITGGLNGTAMGAFTMLSSTDLNEVVEYIKFFSRRWRKQENFAEPILFPPLPAWFQNKAERSQHAAAGKTLYESACMVCHGPQGDGTPMTPAPLMDIWGQAVKPADLREVHLRCGNDLADIYRTLTTGLDGTPMASFAEAFTPEQRWDVVSYVATLRKAEGR